MVYAIPFRAPVSGVRPCFVGPHANIYLLGFRTELVDLLS